MTQRTDKNKVGMSHRKIAKILGCSRGYVELTEKRALKKLLAALLAMGSSREEFFQR